MERKVDSKLPSQQIIALKDLSALTEYCEDKNSVAELWKVQALGARMFCRTTAERFY